MTTISNETARNFLVNYQNLNGYGELEGREGAARYMQKVRCVQFDPLNVVGRNPDLVMQSRIKDYKPDVLFDLLYKKRSLYDAADKMISIIPTEDYPSMARIRQKTVEQLKDILPSIIMAWVMGGIVYCVNFLGLSDIITLLIQVPLGVAIYALGAKLFRMESFDYLLDVIKSIIGKKEKTA